MVISNFAHLSSFSVIELVPLSQWREEKLLELNNKKAKDKQNQAQVSGAPTTSQVDGVSQSAINATNGSPTLNATQSDTSSSGSTANASASPSPTLANASVSGSADTKEAASPSNQTISIESSNGTRPEKLQAAPGSTSSSSARKYSSRDRHNFASAECGAKTLAANSEAREISAVLSSSRDRYMLNPCTAQRKWLVMELCEEVGVSEFKIANFEYFSSMFKDFQLLGAAKYPVSHWYLLGNLTAENVREMQSFEIVSHEPIVWIKYAS